MPPETLWECSPCARRVEVDRDPWALKCKVCGKHMHKVDTTQYFVPDPEFDQWKGAKGIHDRDILNQAADRSFSTYASKRLKPLLERTRAS